MASRAAIILFLSAGLSGASAAAGCAQPFSTATGASGGASTTSTETSDASTGSSSSSASSSGMPACSNTCTGNTYCLMTDCAGAGICEPIGQEGPEANDPVCGCDGYTYFNATVASQAGVAVGSMGPCTTGTHPCLTGSTTCKNAGPTGYCNFQVMGVSPTCTVMPLTGSCWVLPSSCVKTPGGAMGCNTTTCITQCDAIKAELPWIVSTCTPP